MLSDSENLKKLPSPKKKKKSEKSTRHWYSDAEKLEAVKLWMVVGNLPTVAASLGIPFDTVKTWRYSKWWNELVTELRTENTIKLSNRLKKIAEKALDVTMDRLENGDWIYDQKTGEMKRKPVVMRDAMNVAAGLLDRQAKLDDKPQDEAAKQQIQDRLTALADAFAKMANKTRVLEVTDVTPKVLEHSKPQQA
jgi:hypothetical protein